MSATPSVSTSHKSKSTSSSKPAKSTSKASESGKTSESGKASRPSEPKTSDKVSLSKESKQSEKDSSNELVKGLAENYGQKEDKPKITGDGVKADKVDEVKEKVGKFSKDYPQHIQDMLHEVEFEKDKSPTARAEAADGKIKFYEGTKNFNQRIFDHELGHIVGDEIDDKQKGKTDKWDDAGATWNDYIPKGWGDTAKADNRKVSDLGETHAAQDFAEAWAEYQKARRSNKLDKFKAKYPHRAAVIDTIMAGGIPK